MARASEKLKSIDELKSEIDEDATIYELMESICSMKPDEKDFRFGFKFVDEVRLAGFTWFRSQEHLNFVLSEFPTRVESDCEEVLWSGTFDDLVRGEHPVCVETREAFWELTTDEPSERAIPKDNVEEFAEFVAEIGS
jgi:hypothetical protein